MPGIVNLLSSFKISDEVLSQTARNIERTADLQATAINSVVTLTADGMVTVTDERTYIEYIKLKKNSVQPNEIDAQLKKVQAEIDRIEFMFFKKDFSSKKDSSQEVPNFIVGVRNYD